MEIDLSEGNAHGLHVGGTLLIDPGQIVAELSYAIETGTGVFEFTPAPIVSVKREQPLPINELVMHLVLRVDEKLAKRRAVLAPELFYVLVAPKPSPAACARRICRSISASRTKSPGCIFISCTSSASCG
jgi:hypothetical protein